MPLTRLRAAQAIAGALVLPGVATAARAADVSTVKLAIQPIEPSCQPYYAQANGFLDKVGIGVQGGIVVAPTSTIKTARAFAGKTFAVSGLGTIADDAMPPVYLATAWCTTAAWAKAHPDLVARFVRAMNQAAVWANANPDKVVPILVDKLKADPAMLTIGHRPTFTDKLVNAQIQPLIDIVAKYRKVPTLPASDLIFRD